jgi:hypothetical protein
MYTSRTAKYIFMEIDISGVLPKFIIVLYVWLKLKTVINILHKEECAFLSMPWAYHDTSNWFDVHVCFCEYFTLLVVHVLHGSQTSVLFG